jgi:hypothetical protein
MTIPKVTATEPQVAYVRALQRKLSLPDALLDRLCYDTYGRAFASLDVRLCSALINQMKEWEQLPADLMRAKGQMDLFGSDGGKEESDGQSAG